MDVINLIGIVVWVVGLVLAQHQENLSMVKTPISSYIKRSRPLQIGFLSLAIGLWAYAYALDGAARWLFLVAGIGALIVVATRSVWQTRQWVHVTGAVLAYGCMIAGCLDASYEVTPYLFGFALTLPIAALVLLRMKAIVAVDERVIGYPLIAWFAISDISHLMGVTAWSVLA